MKIKKIIFPFKSDHKRLQLRWWHRLLVVLYLLIIFFIILTSIYLGLTQKDIWKGQRVNLTSKVLISLNDFTTRQEISAINTTPLFIEKYPNIGCLKDHKAIEELSSYEVQREVFCNRDISSNVEEISYEITKNSVALLQYKGKEDQLVRHINELLSNDTEKKYCLVPKNFECSADAIVAYKNNILFYVIGLAILAIGVYLTSLLLQFLYFRGFIYIIYGNLKDKEK